MIDNKMGVNEHRVILIYTHFIVKAWIKSNLLITSGSFLINNKKYNE